MQIQVVFRGVEQDERDLALELIATDDLRPEGILENGTKYWGAFVNGKLVGLIGCEYEKQYGLLRSAIVAKDFRGQGIGKQLTKLLLSDAERKKLHAIYLFSTGVGQYWRSLGFEEALVSEVVDKLADTPQVKLFNDLGWLLTEVAYKFDLQIKLEDTTAKN